MELVVLLFFLFFSSYALSRFLSTTNFSPMKKHLKSNWTIYTIGAFGGLIASFKPDYWWVYIIVFGIVVGAIDTYFTKDKKKENKK